MIEHILTVAVLAVFFFYVAIGLLIVTGRLWWDVPAEPPYDPARWNGENPDDDDVLP